MRDRVRYGALGLALSAAVSWIFYKSLLLFLAAGPLAAFFLPVLMKKKLCAQRKERLCLGFREAIGILSGYISSGFSVENAFGSSLSQLVRLFGEEAEITIEFAVIYNGIKLGRQAGELIMDFGERSGNDDIKSFARVFTIAGRTGGSLTGIIDRTASVLREKMAVAEDIKNITADKRFEQKIMTVIPFGLVLYLDVTNPGFLTPMYTTAAGRAIMTAGLLILFLSVKLSRKILDIRV